METRYVLFDAPTGEIRMCGTCDDSELAALGAIAGPPNVSARLHYVQNGQVVAYTETQREAKSSASMMFGHAWDNTVMALVDSRPLVARKDAKRDEMRKAAMAADQADINVSGVNFKADTETRSELMHEALLAQMAVADGLAYSLDWERANGNDITLTAVHLKGLIRAINQRTVTIRTTFKARRQQIAVATTKAQLDAIQW